MNPFHKFQGKSKKFFQKKVYDPVDERDVETTDGEQVSHTCLLKKPGRSRKRSSLG
tara:strand:- start:190 stop:357 length:168 start_codon:yes stop_codon:yes gene_type:complete